MIMVISLSEEEKTIDSCVLFHLCTQEVIGLERRYKLYRCNDIGERQNVRDRE